MIDARGWLCILGVLIANVCGVFRFDPFTGFVLAIIPIFYALYCMEDPSITKWVRKHFDE